jgi:nitrite reductase/ring-hydroxylating ferredoxin subunit
MQVMDWEKVAALGDMPNDGTLQVAFRGEPVCLYNIAGTIYATHDTCTHEHASLAEGFILDGEKIECPLHQGLFEVATGKAVGEPCTVDLKTYAVKVENGMVYVAERK